MAVLTTALKTIAVLMCSLLLAAIVGSIGSIFLEVLLPRFFSALLPYALWLVIGIYCGLLSFGGAGAWASGHASPWGWRGKIPETQGEGDWITRPGAKRIGTTVAIVGMIVIVPLGVLFHLISHDGHSLTFFVSVMIGMILGRWSLMPDDSARLSGNPIR
ncbi:hypothetical protein CVO77_00085 [Sphingopyxis lindanitolerans]|uniref:Uncharacterized protein n=1 Tax=Sphingopyxis lindanitolerans TaxID=2054227 RepID=A0A2S8BAL7_9SPHN|nr:hypothetical protein [Sphingopyxis lindanitolerans]PQM29376.1 hypothetical protein CVO77_00085 [Sphingopyxis lindanitolerans]